MPNRCPPYRSPLHLPSKHPQAALASEAEPRTVKFGRERAAYGRYAAIDGQGCLQQARQSSRVL